MLVLEKAISIKCIHVFSPAKKDTISGHKKFRIDNEDIKTLQLPNVPDF